MRLIGPEEDLPKISSDAEMIVRIAAMVCEMASRLGYKEAAAILDKYVHEYCEYVEKSKRDKTSPRS